ncbi:MAG: glycosyltransferase [Beijerinckiaceae bacterium]|nr:glycosyltransferase [Beijerinckiaceae bacterium]
MTVLLWILVLLWVVFTILNTVSAWRYTWGLPLEEIPGITPPAAVIVAVKNTSDLSRAFFTRLRNQAYPDYRIIAAVESEEDPAFAMLTEEIKRPGAALHIVVAGYSESAGQKVWNLLAALGEIGDHDEIVAFVDADTLPTPEWLSRLVAGLVNAGREAVTGYRWIIPADNRVSSAVVAAANASIVTLPRLPFVINHCWGGMTATRSKTLDHIGIRRYWAGALSDDAQMTRAFRDGGYPVYSPRQSLLLSPVSMNWREAFSFGRRQYRILLLHDKVIWILAALGTAFPISAALAAMYMASRGSALAMTAIAVTVVLGDIRYRCRRKIVDALWGGEPAARGKMYWLTERWLRPIWWTFHALCVFSALGSRHIHWAGIDYWVQAPQRVKVLRPTAAKPRS